MHREAAFAAAFLQPVSAAEAQPDTCAGRAGRAERTSAPSQGAEVQEVFVPRAPLLRALPDFYPRVEAEEVEAEEVEAEGSGARSARQGPTETALPRPLRLRDRDAAVATGGH